MRVPDDVKSKIQAYADSWNRLSQNNLRRWQADEKRQARLMTERRKRRRELLRSANELFGWCGEFLKTPEAAVLMNFEWDEFPLFVGRFWKHEPTSSPTEYAKLVLCVRPRAERVAAWKEFSLRYDEYHDGAVASRSSGMVFPKDAYSLLPPDFLAAAARHLKCPAAWAFIIQEVDRRMFRQT